MTISMRRRSSCRRRSMRRLASCRRICRRHRPIMKPTRPMRRSWFLGLTSDILPITTVDDYAESILSQKLSQVAGVGLVSIGRRTASGYSIADRSRETRGPTASILRTCATHWTNVSVDQPKGHAVRTHPFVFAADERPDPHAGRLEPADHCLSQWWSHQGVGRRQCRDRPTGSNAGGLGSTATAASLSLYSGCPGAKRHRDRGPDQGRIAPAHGHHAADDQCLGDLGSNDNHPARRLPTSSSRCC